MDRRLFLSSGVAAAALAVTREQGALAQTGAPAAPGDARLNRAFDQVLAATLRDAPELATSLGLDTGCQREPAPPALTTGVTARSPRGSQGPTGARRGGRGRSCDALAPGADRPRVVLFSIESDMLGT
jgi:hypothetical protein